MKQRSYRRTTGKVALIFAAMALLGTLFLPSAFAAHTNSTADLSATQQGDPDGTGTVDLTFDEGTGEVCYTLATADIGAVTSAHIHEGVAGTTGAVVVDFDVPTNGLDNCVTADPVVVQGITANPSGFYVNVHNAEYPNGAVRAQIGAVANSTTQFSSTTDLAVVVTSGTAQDTPGDANAAASGTIDLKFDTVADEVCYMLTTDGLSSATTGLHIHQGGTGQVGAVLVALSTASPVADSGCAPGASADIDAILANEAGHYVNLHTADAGNGAIRAQVADTTALKTASAALDGLGFGDPDGSGTATLTFYPGGNICYDLVVNDIDTATAAHVHTGSDGEIGAVVVALDLAGQGLDGCVESDDATIDAIKAMPSAFYVNVHNAQYPDGAIRGQLTATSPAPATVPLTLRLDPSGDIDGNGIATLNLDPATGRVCFDIMATNIDAPTAAHIHTGEVGTDGAVLIDLDVPTNGTTGCVFAMDTDVQTVVADLQGHYLNVHNAANPSGAVRQQLEALCNGQAITVNLNLTPAQVPTNGDDVIYGTNNADEIDALDGNDTVCAGGGDDIVRAGIGDDVVFGEAGDDTLRGFDGVDTLDGGDGNDRVFGNKGADLINGGEGDDILHGNRGADTINGDGGNDRIYGYSQNDILNGGDGDDRMHGNYGSDIMNGGAGNDRMFGYADNDTINGGEGNDLIGGNFGEDIINGDAGDDTLFGSDGNDTVSGGEGNDVVAGNSSDDIVNGDAGDDALDGGIGTDICDGGAGTDTAARCETVIGFP